MSKGRSGLFPHSNSNDRILRKTTYKAIHSLLDETKGKKKNGAVVGAYDIKTGMIVIEFSGKLPRKIHPYLLSLAKKIGGVGSKGVSKDNIVGSCAEFKAVNKLLLAGSKFSDIRLTQAFRPRTRKPMATCINCKALFHELLK